MKRVVEVIATGIVMGCVHVLTGPDHLSALATLSNNATVCHAFRLGIQWGIGHSSGLLVMTIIIVLTTSDGSEKKWDTSPIVRHTLETVVGLFMLALGGSTLIMAVRKKRQRKRVVNTQLVKKSIIRASSAVDGYASSTDESSTSGSERESSPLVSCINNTSSVHPLSYQSIDNCCSTATTTSKNLCNGIMWLPLVPNVADSPTVTKEKNYYMEEDFTTPSSSEDCCHHHDHHDEESQLLSRCLESTLRRVAPCCCHNISIRNDSCSGRIVAFIVGLVHGVAGPGGILAVIPAMHLHNWKLACLYLLCFCLTSTLTMGIFASLYGSCSTALSSTSAEFPIACFSSFLSIAVGITWLTLLSLGKLDEVFD